MSTFAGAQPFSEPKSVPGTGFKQLFQQQFTPEQMELFKQMFSQVGPGSYLSRLAGGDEDLFRQIEAPALRQFGEFQGNLASRFSGMGSRGARRSSGFQNQATQGGIDLAERLQSQRQGLQQQALRDLMSMSQQLLSERPYEHMLLRQEEEEPFWQKLLAGGLPIAGAGIGGFFGGLPGASLGGKLGSAAGRAFM